MFSQHYIFSCIIGQCFFAVSPHVAISFTARLYGVVLVSCCKIFIKYLTHAGMSTVWNPHISCGEIQYKGYAQRRDPEKVTSETPSLMKPWAIFLCSQRRTKGEEKLAVDLRLFLTSWETELRLLSIGITKSRRGTNKFLNEDQGFYKNFILDVLKIRISKRSIMYTQRDIPNAGQDSNRAH